LTDPATERPGAYAKAVDLLARRAHFTAQLRDKLGRRGYPPEEVEEALARLARHGYLDDRAAARDFAAGRLAKEPLGRRRLAADLGRRGAPEEVVSEVLDELLPADDRAAAREAAETWLARRREPNKAALARWLERRGFSPAAIWGALDAVEWPGADGEDPGV
jgi:regulatory protein